MIFGEKDESTSVSLELRPVPFPLVGWIWIGAAFAVVGIGLWVALSNATLGFTILSFGLLSLPFNPPLHSHTPSRLDVDAHSIRFLRRKSVVKLLPWNRVEKVQYGARRMRRMKTTFPVDNRNERVYIRFVASTDLESIRVDGFEYELKPDEIQRVLDAISDLTKRHSVPVEEKEWLVHS